jgi:hypothetical protein
MVRALAVAKELEDEGGIRRRSLNVMDSTVNREL